ncbi:hypothetical protein EFM09_03060 [Latilactobacillus curvatus]|uniref:L-type lectin-domain containing protein n=1 Tax=Latilactobacillus curvatus TaxID=28038 RepID=UPI00097714E0|nr:L-type lectin-domain containing protein [Latilactobacillus curvatus]MCT1215539.1 hypothetical protein [Latilactobacillus curvatus]MCT3525563.1 hypothetical protein [Latilactobacillus curvatus]UTB71204.1 hypothetical protein A4W71_09260 [Latilactobacillus curvatus]UTB73500.1 hypothetical protein A4W73_00860 [Latilactobacillus curvatus]UTC11314.1 hypothetical protein A4W79_09070 [Latilactobacillus curvatus]
MRFNKIFKQILLGIGMLVGTTVVMHQSVQATIAPVPDHITNIENLFAAPPVGSNSSLPVNGVTEINPNTTNQSGAIWSNENNKLDLSNDFSATMLLNFGDSGASAADGMAFVMHNDPRGTKTIQTGGTGQQLGVWADPIVDSSSSKISLSNAIQKSFAVEFDTRQNDKWDVSEAPKNTSSSFLGITNYYSYTTKLINGNHIAFGLPADLSSYFTGVSGSSSLLTDRRRYTSFMNHQGLQTLPANTYLSDGKWHEFNVNWNATTKILSYQFQGLPEVRVSINPIAAFGTTNVYWGFTGKTGGSSELNQVAFKSISNIPTTSQSYKIYHKDGAEVTKANPAKPFEELNGVISANNLATSGSAWKKVALRYKTEGTSDDAGGVSYLGHDLTVNGQLVSKDGASTNLVKTPQLSLTGTGLSQRSATEADFFGTNNAQYSTGVDLGDIQIGKTAASTFTLTAMGPTPTDGTTNLGRHYDISLVGTTVSQSTQTTAYVTSVPQLELGTDWEAAKDKAKPVTIKKGQPLNIDGTWSQLSSFGIDPHAVGTLHYSIDNGAEQIVAQNNTGGKLISNIPTDGLSLNNDHTITFYVTNAGYNEKSEVKTVHFKVKGGDLTFSKVNDTIGFKPVEVGQNVIAQRNAADWAPTVSDGRGAGSDWTLLVTGSYLQRDTDGELLSGGLVYVDGNNKQTNIGKMPVKVASKVTTTDDETTPVSWNDNQGVLLKVNGSAYKGSYHGEINWILQGSTPNP